MPRRKHHQVYVIELSKDVLLEPRFRKDNPGYVEGKPCVYVGMTGLGPKAVEKALQGYAHAVKSTTVSAQAPDLADALVMLARDRQRALREPSCRRAELTLSDRTRRNTAFGE
jgi:hypothetical protein